MRQKVSFPAVYLQQSAVKLNQQQTDWLFTFYFLSHRSYVNSTQAECSMVIFTVSLLVA